MEKGISDIAVVRVEQIYPIPKKQINEILQKYKGAEIIWAQDEPENMGAWPMINRKLKNIGFKLVSRPESASPAAGLMEIHKKSLQKILNAIFEEKEVVTS